MDTAFSPPVQIVTSDAPCTRCGYSLRGLQVTGKCPECAWSVEASLRGGLLRFAGPEYLASLELGTRIVIITNLANAAMSIIAMAVGIVAIFMLGGFSTPTPGAPAPPLAAIDLIDSAATALSLLATMASLAGYWLLTAPDPATSQTEQPRTARRIVRIAVVTSALVQAIALVMSFLTPRFATGTPTPVASPALALTIASSDLGLLGAVAGGVQFFAMMLYCRWIAQRIPDGSMVEQTRTYLWLLPLLFTVGAFCIGIGPLVAWVLYLILLWNLRKQILLAREQSLTLAAG